MILCVFLSKGYKNHHYTFYPPRFLLIYKELYNYYQEDTRQIHGDDPSALTEALASSDYFNKVWKERFPSLKMKTRGDFMVCGICTQLKDTLHGQAGVRSSHSHDRVDDVKAKYTAHLQVVRVLADSRICD